MVSDIRVDVALPVFDGEAYLADAIEAILAQTHRNLTLHIGDNASTDGTEAICRQYATRDHRIEYYRRPENIGAAPNFNRLFHAGTAPYFKWMAADDLVAPEFIERCVAELENHPDAVVAFTQVDEIDQAGQQIAVDDPAARLDFDDAIDRFASLVDFHNKPCYEIFGVMRRSALVDTDLIAPFTGGDRNLLAHLALRGEFRVVPERLAGQRIHPAQSQQYVSDKAQYDEWFDPANRDRRRMTEWNRYWNYAKLVVGEPLTAVDRARAATAIGSQAWRRKRQLASDLRRWATSL